MKDIFCKPAKLQSLMYSHSAENVLTVKHRICWKSITWKGNEAVIYSIENLKVCAVTLSLRKYALIAYPINMKVLTCTVTAHRYITQHCRKVGDGAVLHAQQLSKSVYKCTNSWTICNLLWCSIHEIQYTKFAYWRDPTIIVLSLSIKIKYW